MYAIIRSAYDLAVFYAKHYQLSIQEQEDCGGSIQLKILVKSAIDQIFARRITDEAFRRRYANYFVRDRIKAIHRLREESLFRPGFETGEFIEREIPDDRDNPDKSMDRDSFWQFVRESVPQLTARSFDILQRSLRGNQTHAEIAAETGLKVNTVDKILFRAIKTIILACKEQGLTAGDFGEFLSPPLTHFYLFWNTRIRMDRYRK